MLREFDIKLAPTYLASLSPEDTEILSSRNATIFIYNIKYILLKIFNMRHSRPQITKHLRIRRITEKHFYFYLHKRQIYNLSHEFSERVNRFSRNNNVISLMVNFIEVRANWVQYPLSGTEMLVVRRNNSLRELNVTRSLVSDRKHIRWKSNSLAGIYGASK